MKYAFIEKHQSLFKIDRMCRTLGVSRSGYYGWRNHSPSARDRANLLLIQKIRQVHLESRQTYGSPRIHAQLNSQGDRCGRHRVARLMRQNQIVAKMTRRFRLASRVRKNNPPPAPNRLQVPFVVQEANRQWVSDLTFIPTKGGFLYLAIVLDLFSRTVVGWAMDLRLARTLVCEALQMAILRRRPKPGTIIHSDQGSQYASYDYKRLLKSHGLLASMSRKGYCWDNAVAESFFHTLKTELVYSENYVTREQAKLSLFEYIEVFYNRFRRHSTLNYKSPVAFETNNPAP